MGFTLHDNASLRYFKIEKQQNEEIFFFVVPQALNYVKTSLMLVDAQLEEYSDAPY